MTNTFRPLAFVLAVLACGHALGQEGGHPEKLSLYGVAMRTMASEHAPLQRSLRLYDDSSSALRLGSPSALPTRTPRIGVELNLVPAPSLALANGTLLRTRLSEGTHLSLRVRRHGVSVVLRSEF